MTGDDVFAITEPNASVAEPGEAIPKHHEQKEASYISFVYECGITEHVYLNVEFSY